jgi:hypothetical protein
MRATLLAAFVALCLSLTAPPAARANIDLAYQPMRVDLHLVPGQVQTGVIQLKNQGGAPMHLRARMLDFYVSGDNTPQFATLDDDAYSCRKWTILNPTEVDITPDAMLTFRYTIQVPAVPVSAARTFRCAVAFESMPTLEDRLQERAANQVRLVTVLYATLGNPVAKPEIGDPEIVKSGKDWQVQVPFANSGETHYRLTGTLLIKDSAGATVQNVEMDSSPIHPQASLRVEFPIDPLHKGEYTMEVQLKFGSKILVKEAAVEVEPSE